MPRSPRALLAATLALALAFTLAACDRSVEVHTAAAPDAPTAEWNINQTVSVMNESLRELITEKQMTPRYLQLVDGVLRDPVKSRVLQITRRLLKSNRLEQVVAQDPQPPRIVVQQLYAYTPDCVIVGMTIEGARQRVAGQPIDAAKPDRVAALFRRDPAGPDPLGVNPTGWRWEAVIRSPRENAGLATATTVASETDVQVASACGATSPCSNQDAMPNAADLRSALATGLRCL